MEDIEMKKEDVKLIGCLGIWIAVSFLAGLYIGAAFVRVSGIPFP